MRRMLLQLLLLTTFITPVCAQDNIQSRINQRITHFEQRYGIELRYQDMHPVKDGIYFKLLEHEDLVALDAYLKLFEEEVNKYPPTFFRDREIRGIGLVKYLFVKKKQAQGVYSSGLRIMFFDILRYGNNKAQQRHGIHHELFHMMAFQSPSYVPFKDAQWGATNAQHFKYGDPKISRNKRNPYNQYAPQEPGFVTYYAMTSMEEDKAEVFACLMQAKHKKLIEEWQQKDQVMRQKISQMKAFVAHYCPDMNEEFWKSIVN